jgi:hypothetical protein
VKDRGLCGTSTAGDVGFRLAKKAKKQVEHNGLRTPVRRSVEKPAVLAWHFEQPRSRIRLENVHSKP